MESGLLRELASSALTPELTVPKEEKGSGVVRLEGRVDGEEQSLLSWWWSLLSQGLGVSILRGPPILAWVPMDLWLSAVDGGGNRLELPGGGSKSVTLTSADEEAWWGLGSPPCPWVMDSRDVLAEV